MFCDHLQLKLCPQINDVTHSCDINLHICGSQTLADGLRITRFTYQINTVYLILKLLPNTVATKDVIYLQVTVRLLCVVKIQRFRTNCLFLGCTPLFYPAATEQNRQQSSKNKQQRGRDSKQGLLDHSAVLTLHQSGWLKLI